MRQPLSRWGRTSPQAPGATLVMLLVGTLVSVLGAIGACSNPAGVTPDCTFNVDTAGIHLVDGGCEKLPVCQKAPDDPGQCCPDASPDSGDRQNCLAGYGVYEGTGGSGTGGSGTGGS